MTSLGVEFQPFSDRCTVDPEVLGFPFLACLSNTDIGETFYLVCSVVVHPPSLGQLT